MNDNRPDNGLEKYVDMEGALARVRGNMKLYRRMLDLYLKSEEFDAFDSAIAAGDYAAAADRAHAIKGITGNLSLPELFRMSTELMAQLRGGSADDTLLAEFREAVAKTREEVIRLAEKIDAEN